MVEKSKASKKECVPFCKKTAKHTGEVETRGNFEVHHSDSENFIETAIWGLEAAVEAAYRAGFEAGRKERK